jgi:hypothetical protein
MSTTCKTNEECSVCCINGVCSSAYNCGSNIQSSYTLAIFLVFLITSFILTVIIICRAKSQKEAAKKNFPKGHEYIPRLFDDDMDGLEGDNLSITGRTGTMRTMSNAYARTPEGENYSPTKRLKFTPVVPAFESK